MTPLGVFQMSKWGADSLTVSDKIQKPSFLAELLPVSLLDMCDSWFNIIHFYKSVF